jgi:hypothetical protein
MLNFQAATKQLPPGNSVRTALELVLQRAQEVMRERAQNIGAEFQIWSRPNAGTE